MTQKPILNDTHRALGAKMVDFGGWDMPIHYGSQIEEHHQVRRGAAMFEVSHMTVVDLRGPPTPEVLLLLRWEWGYIQAALKLSHGNVSQAARLLGVNRTTLYNRMEVLERDLGAATNTG